MRILLLSWLFFIPLSSTLLSGSVSVSVSGQCLDDQKSYLLEFKNSLNFTSKVSTKLVSTKLSNWIRSTDCCRWNGVACDQNGRVTGLDLNSESISGIIEPSISLFSLQYLISLNLANNSFNSTQISPNIGNLTNLRYLNLSNAGFSGQIPVGLSRLTNLVTLDLSTLYFPGILSLQIENPNLETLFHNLSGIRELYLDGVNMSANGNDWGQAISSSLPNLQVLSLRSCYLSGPIDSSLQNLTSLSKIDLGSNNLSAPVPDFFENFANLTALSLSSSNLYGYFPEKIFQIAKLQTLELENNELLSGSLPEFPQNGSIRNLVLSETNFSGRLPESLGNLTKLSTIEISRCNFSGSIPNSLANLRQLVYLDLSTNNFSGTIPSFQSSKNLRYVDLSYNALTGPIPSTHFEGLSNLVFIDLAYNSFNGSIPSSLFSLQSLKNIQLSNNKFDEVSGIQNGSLSPLDTLDLSSNKLKGPIPLYFFDFPRLNVLSLSFNNFNGTVQLESVHGLENLTRLELSYNSLSVNASISNSSLSSFPQLSILRLASCKLQKFPALRNQSRMIQLDLSNNQISGEIPYWIWNVGNGRLMYLNLSRNLLVGLQRNYVVPSLSVLDLHSNQLQGEIPIPPESAIYVDYSSNNFSSSVPAEIGNNLTFAIFFSLSNNKLTGTIPPSMCSASYLQVLDLSHNGFSSTIPRCLIESSTLTLGVLNLGTNNLAGNISGIFPQGCALKTLDLNGNHLEGQVPESLVSCSKLEVLNLGKNRMYASFPCFLKDSSSLRVLVLRSNMFQGSIRCPRASDDTWPKLQIVDLASNNFSGDLPPKCFLHWKAMMVNGQQDLNHLRFEFLNLNNFYYQDKVTVALKGLQIELVKILTVFTSVDFSFNSFEGEIPRTIGALSSLYVLNLSRNALTGPIPSALGNLSQLESLDLSRNKLNGSIPVTLTDLTFLSVLNLSYNQLLGSIPRGSQFDTFENSSFEGNKGLCGPPLSTLCKDTPLVPSPSPSSNHSGSVFKTGFDWQFIFTGLGFGLGAGFVVGPLMFWKRGSSWCDEHIETFVWMILPTVGFIFSWCTGVKVDSEVKIKEEPSDETGDSDENDDDEKEGKAFSGQYCVFCSKLDIHRKKAVHNPKCSCHEPPSIPAS